MPGVDGTSNDLNDPSWVLSAAAGIGDAMVVVDSRGRLAYKNTAAERLIGVGTILLPEDLSRWSSELGFYFPDEHTRFPSAELPLQRALAGSEVRDVALFVKNHVVPAGCHLISSASTLRLPDGSIRGAVCVLRDMTVMRQREGQLREAERQRKAILDNIPDSAWLKDERGRYVVINQRLVEALGCQRLEDVLGRTDFDFFPREHAEAYRRDDEEVMRTGLQKVVEEPMIFPTGKAIWVETVKIRIVDDIGRVIGSTGIARDMTARKAAEEAMRSTKDELERRVLERTAALAEAQENLVRQERLAILGQLAGGVAHQIRNPLAAIMNATYVLKRHLSPEQHPNVEDAIRIIHDEVRHANVIITGLLDYARVRTPDRHPASIVDLLDRILSSDWIPDNVRVTRKLPAPDSVVRCVDADQFQGAIANLIRNAVDAMPDGGELALALDVAEGELVITVTDTGTGISPAVRARLFEPLHSTKPMGLGLGLVTARRFIEAHGGRISSVDVDRGACFQIRLPTT